MYTNNMLSLAVMLTLAVVLAGCGSATGKVRDGHYNNDKTFTYGRAFEMAFQNGAWSESKDAQGVPIVQFTGQISPGLHDFVSASLNKRGERAIFISACEYTTALMKNGKPEGQQNISFKVSDYPVIQQGNLVAAALDTFLTAPDNKAKIRLLNIFFMNRYWEGGSPCTFQWKVAGKGDYPVVKMTNIHWDDDKEFSGKPELVLPIIFDYARSLSR
jgi:hypothetical protein